VFRVGGLEPIQALRLSFRGTLVDRLGVARTATGKHDNLGDDKRDQAMDDQIPS
jgi:hypothetical protein